jgi:hypothetical protein
MTSEMNNGDSALEPDSPEDNQFLSDEWTSEAGALIEVSIDPSSWHSPLIADLKKRGPVMLDHIASRLSLDPQMVSLLLCNDVDMRSMNLQHRGLINQPMFCHFRQVMICIWMMICLKWMAASAILPLLVKR